MNMTGMWISDSRGGLITQMELRSVPLININLDNAFFRKPRIPTSQSRVSYLHLWVVNRYKTTLEMCRLRLE